MLNRAQGTIEYLLIIGIILVISLLVTGLMSGFFNAGGAINEQESRIFWAAQPIAIIDGIVDVNGNGIFVIRNNEPEVNTVYSITVDGTAHAIAGGSGIKLGNTDKNNITLTDLTPCSSNSGAYTISISYVSQKGISKNTQTHAFVVYCSTGLSVGSSSASFTVTGTPEVGSIIIRSGSNWIPSSIAGSNSGIVIDTNTLCLNGATCDQNIDWNGTDIIFSSS